MMTKILGKLENFPHTIYKLVLVNSTITVLMCWISGPVLTHTLSRSPDSDCAIIRSAGQHAGKLGVPVNTVNRPSVSFQDHYRFFFPQVPQVYFVIYMVQKYDRKDQPMTHQRVDKNKMNE